METDPNESNRTHNTLLPTNSARSDGPAEISVPRRHHEINNVELEVQQHLHEEIQPAHFEPVYVLEVIKLKICANLTAFNCKNLILGSSCSTADITKQC